MDTGTKWEHYNAGQHARVSSMAGITYFVALPFDVADGSIVVGDPMRSAVADRHAILYDGPLLVAIDLHLLTEDAPRNAPERLFDRASLAVAENSDGTAVYATDFQPDPSGFVPILARLAPIQLMCY
jgi:Protein of unknown function (DUF3422)